MLAGIAAFLFVWILLRLLLAITDLSRIQTSAAIRAGGVICIHQCRLRCCRLLQQTTAQTKQAAARRSPNHGLISSLETAPRNINPRNRSYYFYSFIIYPANSAYASLLFCCFSSITCWSIISFTFIRRVWLPRSSSSSFRPSAKPVAAGAPCR